MEKDKIVFKVSQIYKVRNNRNIVAFFFYCVIAGTEPTTP